MLPHWCHAPSLASRSLTGAALPGGAPINAGKASPTGRILSEALRRGLPSAGILPRRCLGSSRDQRVCRFIPTCRGWRTDALLCGLVGILHNCASRHSQLPRFSFKFAMDGIDRSREKYPKTMSEEGCMRYASGGARCLSAPICPTVKKVGRRCLIVACWHCRYSRPVPSLSPPSVCRPP